MKKVCMIALLCCLAGSPAWSGTFSIFGSYWDTDEAGEAGGAGVGVGIPLGQVVDLELRGTYFEELSEDPLEALFDPDDPVFRDFSLTVVPIEAGLRVKFMPGQAFTPYLSAGAAYYLLDIDRGELDDEAGWYAGLGAMFGDGQGIDFFAEALYRGVEATVELDPEDIDDIDDIDFQGDQVDLDLAGPAANVGVVWRF